MRRRATSRFARTTLVLAVASALAAAGLAACGDSSGGSSPAPTATVTVTPTPSASPSPTTAPTATPQPATTISLYFLRGGKLGSAQRRVPQTTMPATAALKALLTGPTAAEQAAGLTSAVPTGVRLLGLSIDGTTARVDLPGRFVAGGSDLSWQERVAQVVYTLTRFPTIRAVDITLAGGLVEIAPGSDLGLILAKQSRADWRAFEPAIFVETPGVGAVLSSPFALNGTASVFEGSFAARLVDAAGHSLVRRQVQAFAGAPGRGRFRTTVSFSTTAQSGALIVYSQSMEDGSRQNEVRIPVTFSSD